MFAYSLYEVFRRPPRIFQGIGDCSLTGSGLVTSGFELRKSGYSVSETTAFSIRRRVSDSYVYYSNLDDPVFGRCGQFHFKHF